jgi:hypothetical protein
VYATSHLHPSGGSLAVALQALLRFVEEIYFSLYGFVRFEAFIAVAMNNAVFWDVMPCSLVES